MSDEDSDREKDSSGAKLHDAILADSVALVQEYLETGTDPNTAFCFQYSQPASVATTPQRREQEGTKFSSADTGLLVYVPPLHQAVRNCYDNSKCRVYETIAHGTLGTDGWKNSEKILKLLLAHGADPSTEAAFVACCIRGDRKQYSGTALGFAILLKQNLDRDCAEFQGMAMDIVIEALQKATQNAGGMRPRMVQVPASTHNLWSALLLSERYSDVTFETEGQTFHAHKCVLATASSYFEALFSGRWSEREDKRIRTSNSPAIVRALLSFIYTGSLQATVLESNTAELLTCASEYDLPALKAQCEQRYIARLQVSNLRDSLLLAHLHRCEALKRACYVFVGRNATKVLTRPEIMSLAQEDPPLWSELVREIGGGDGPPGNAAGGAVSAGGKDPAAKRQRVTR